MSELQQFGGDWTIEKLDILTSYLDAYLTALKKTIFPAVARNPRVFHNERNSPLFLFCFAVSSSSKPAQGLALRIAEHILQSKR